MESSLLLSLPESRDPAELPSEFLRFPFCDAGSDLTRCASGISSSEDIVVLVGGRGWTRIKGSTPPHRFLLLSRSFHFAAK